MTPGSRFDYSDHRHPGLCLPGPACVLAARLGITSTPTFSLNQGCAGFIYALSLADQYIKTGTYHTILVLGAETFPRYSCTTTVDVTCRCSCRRRRCGHHGPSRRRRAPVALLSHHCIRMGRYSTNSTPRCSAPVHSAAGKEEGRRGPYPAAHGRPGGVRASDTTLP